MKVEDKQKIIDETRVMHRNRLMVPFETMCHTSNTGNPAGKTGSGKRTEHELAIAGFVSEIR